MKIYKYEIPDKMILNYCRIITMFETGYSTHIERARSEVHNEIFDYVGCCRAGDTRDDREFIIALDRMVCKLTYKE